MEREILLTLGIKLAPLDLMVISKECGNFICLIVKEGLNQETLT